MVHFQASPAAFSAVRKGNINDTRIIQRSVRILNGERVDINLCAITERNGIAAHAGYITNLWKIHRQSPEYNCQ